MQRFWALHRIFLGAAWRNLQLWFCINLGEGLSCTQGTGGAGLWLWLLPFLLPLGLVTLGKQINSSALSLPPESQGCRMHFHLFKHIKADPIVNCVFKMNSCSKNRPWKYSVCKQTPNFSVLERMTKVECVSNPTEVRHADTQVKIPESQQSEVGKKKIINIPIHFLSFILVIHSIQFTVLGWKKKKKSCSWELCNWILRQVKNFPS